MGCKGFLLKEKVEEGRREERRRGEKGREGGKGHGGRGREKGEKGRVEVGGDGYMYGWHIGVGWIGSE